jgi:prepilin signal peptidase PulO-like enzyme (type II secretory pathway)
LILLSDNSTMPDNDNGFVRSHITSFSPMIQGFFISLRFAVLSALLGSLVMASSAWAYKVEKICEDVPATSKEPAYKKCKVVKAKEGGSAKGDGKGDGKGDAKGDGKGDGKGASKGDAKADAKK